MIKKFIKIKNVGNFKDFAASGDITFSKVNIVYGENSAGKSTLASIIHSIILNKTDLVLERKTFGTNGEQHIELLFEYDNNKQVLKFQNSKWDNWNDGFKNIEIFDEFFISENIYTGLDILSEHQKYLYQFAIGQEGVNLAKEIEEIKKDLQSKKYPALSSLSERIKILTDEYFEVERFVKLVEDGEIDKKIEEKKREISVAEALEEIKEKQFLSEIQPLSLPFDLDNLKILLLKSLTTISAEALQEATQHISKLTGIIGKEAESWLHQGLLCVETIKDNKCPFCQQDLIKAESIIKSHQQYFNEQYREFKEDINKYLEQINRTNIVQLLNDIKDIILNNNALIEFWKKFISDSEFPALQNLEQYVKQIKDVFNKVTLLVENKLKRILEPIEINDIDNLSRSVESLNASINEYNSNVRILNEKIRELKRKHLEINTLRSDLKKFEIQKKRYSDDSVRELCDEYQECQKKIEELKQQVEQKKGDLNRAISQKVEKYGKETNSILEKFGVPFRIIKHNPRYRGRGEEPYFEYFLEMEEAEVNPLQKAKFTLSGGDRNALALAFFLAKIDLDGDIRDKILVFDDPVSSLDRNRRKATVEKIRDLSEKVNQIIVFTHYETFAYELYESLKKIRANPKTLEIKNRQIKEWNIEEEIKLPYFKKLDKLEKFWGNEEDISETEARKLIREVLEDRLKLGYYKYLKDLGDRCILGPIIDKFRKLIREKDKKLKMFKHEDDDEVVKELSDMEEFSSEEHHGTIDKMREKVSPEEIKNYISRTLKLIYEWL